MLSTLSAGDEMAYQIQDGDFHHALVEVGGLIFDNLNRHNLLGFQVLTFHDLTEGALA
jgi:hypothetical protein